MKINSNDFYFPDLDETAADQETRLTAAEENIQGLQCAFNSLTLFVTNLMKPLNFCLNFSQC